MTSVSVLLATWNGARFLDAQLQSLRAQTDAGIHVLARDDGSDDGTRALLDAWAERHPGWLTVLPADGLRRGATGSFGALLAACEAPYAMLCDQDDVWHPDKVARSLERMRALEARHGADHALLVHGDARLLGEDGGLLPGRLAEHMHHRLEDAARLERQVLHNHVTGCTLLMNRALLQLARPIPEDAVWHDWWIGLLACAAGEVASLPGTVLDYRQHAGNALGAGTMRWRELRRRFPDAAAVRRRMQRASRQAAAALARLEGRLGVRERRVLESAAALADQGWLARRASLVAHDLWLPGARRNAALLVFG